MLSKLWAFWLHPHTQEVVGVVFVLLAIYNAAQGRWGRVMVDLVVIFSSVQIIRGSHATQRQASTQKRGNG